MQTKSLRASPSAFNLTTLKVLSATVLLAIAATATQTASAQPGPGDGGRGGRGGHGGGDMMMGGRHLDRMLGAVNATPEQRAQITQIFAAARADLKTQREAGRGLREQSAALFTAPTVDARAAEALRVQMVAQHDASSKRMLQAMLDASRVLTPDQRKTLADKMAQRRTLMERHRSERDALEKTGR